MNNTTAAPDITTIKQLKQIVSSNWAQLKAEADALSLQNHYEILVAIALMPVFILQPEALRQLLSHVRSHQHGEYLANVLERFLKDKPTPSKADMTGFVVDICKKASFDPQEEEALTWLIIATGALAGSQTQNDKGMKFSKDLLKYLKQNSRHPSGIRVQAELITAGQNVIIAGNDVNIVGRFFEGDTGAMNAYLADVRSELNSPDLGNLVSASNKQMSHTIRLHSLYTSLDIWSEAAYQEADESKVYELRLRAVEQDLNHLRTSAIETLAIHPRVVMIGSAGTGKSTLAKFVATCLAYACDATAEKHDKVNGLELLGNSWIHGAVLPIYVNLRNFVADTDSFRDMKQARAQHLLDYLRKKYGKFVDDLERYLLNSAIPVHGTMLFLDGLDEVYEEKDKRLLKKIIENWADRFPKCRIMVTSRSYAYKQNATWRLSEGFKVAELAPYTWKQIQTYVHNWYTQAAYLRPNNFGGREVAAARADLQSKDLVNTILMSKDLWALARQPLLLTLTVLIHEDNRALPEVRAQLYEKAVQLLHEWNVPQPGDPLADKIGGLNFNRVRNALQLVAFDLQRDNTSYRKLPAHVTRAALLERLMQQQKIQPGLGAPIDDVLEYLATRNGILVSGHNSTYRFLHLSIQEFLAACALIEQYDECEMPKKIGSAPEGVWTFPQNIAALLAKDPYRWRDVAIYIGSILASDKNQDPRWSLISHLLPDSVEGKLSEGKVYAIYVAAEIWADTFLKARVHHQRVTKKQLIKNLEVVTLDDRLDAPERARAVTILAQLQTDET